LPGEFGKKPLKIIESRILPALARFGFAFSIPACASISWMHHLTVPCET
jgi:hypothetical protein